ncbi:hypothetical protein SHDE107825_12920 [Shewanella denitrificans]|jgi:hypothetical protein
MASCEKTVHPMDGMFEHPRTDLLRVAEGHAMMRLYANINRLVFSR